MSVQLIAGMDR